MSEISCEISRKGKILNNIKEKINGETINDLLNSLRAMKESSNAFLSGMVEEEKAGVRKLDEPDSCM